MRASDWERQRTDMVKHEFQSFIRTHSTTCRLADRDCLHARSHCSWISIWSGVVLFVPVASEVPFSAFQACDLQCWMLLITELLVALGTCRIFPVSGQRGPIPCCCLRVFSWKEGRARSTCQMIGITNMFRRGGGGGRGGRKIVKLCCLRRFAQTAMQLLFWKHWLYHAAAIFDWLIKFRRGRTFAGPTIADGNQAVLRSVVSAMCREICMSFVLCREHGTPFRIHPALRFLAT